MKRAPLIALLLLVFLLPAAAAAGKSAPAPTPRSTALTVSYLPPEEGSAARKANAAPAPEADYLTLPAATKTPEATFVPLPTTTPDAYGRTPTPGPAWATPYPSPKTPALTVPDTVTVGTVAAEKKVPLRRTPSSTDMYDSFAQPNDTLRLLEVTDGFVKVARNDSEGYIEEKLLQEVREVSTSLSGPLVFRLGSLNIHGCKNTEALQKIGKALYEADLDAVGLQEVYRSGNGKNYLEILAQEADFRYYTFTKTLTRKGADYGIAILSRHPIVLSSSFMLDGYPREEKRALQYAGVLTESGAVHILNTHLSPSEMYKKSVNLASMVYTAKSLFLPTYAVTGDFNCSPARIRDFWEEISFANVTENTYGDGSVPKILDNVLYTGSILVPSVTVTGLGGLTDHALVTAELHISP